MGRPRLANREFVIIDLKNLDMTPEEVAARHCVSRRSIYNIAKEAKIDMVLRNRVIRLREVKRLLELEIEATERLYFSGI